MGCFGEIPKTKEAGKGITVAAVATVATAATANIEH